MIAAPIAWLDWEWPKRRYGAYREGDLIGSWWLIEVVTPFGEKTQLRIKCAKCNHYDRILAKMAGGVAGRSCIGCEDIEAKAEIARLEAEGVRMCLVCAAELLEDRISRTCSIRCDKRWHAAQEGRRRQRKKKKQFQFSLESESEPCEK